MCLEIQHALQYREQNDKMIPAFSKAIIINDKTKYVNWIFNKHILILKGWTVINSLAYQKKFKYSPYQSHVSMTKLHYGIIKRSQHCVLRGTAVEPHFLYTIKSFTFYHAMLNFNNLKMVYNICTCGE